MKTLKLTFVIAFVAISFLANAQTSFDKFYEKYATQAGYTSVNISKELFQMFANIGDQKDTDTTGYEKNDGSA